MFYKGSQRTYNKILTFIYNMTWYKIFTQILIEQYLYDKTIFLTISIFFLYNT